MKIPIVFIILSAVSFVYGARILAVFPCASKSHFFYGQPLCLELAKRGHEVTVLSHFPQTTKVKHYRDISIAGSLPMFHNNMSFALFSDQVGNVYTSMFLSMVVFHQDLVSHENIFNVPAVKQLINSSDENFDLVITEIFNNDAFAGFAHKFDAPLISLVSSIALPWSTARVAIPDNPSYISHFFSLTTSDMNLINRVINTIRLIFCKIVYCYFNIISESMAKRHFGDSLPPLTEIVANTSMVFVNSNPALHSVRPVVPQFVEVGGFHVATPKPLPQEIEKFINESKHGVVYFSMGSMVKLSTLPEDKFLAFKTVLSHLPQRVLWKWEEDTMPDQPKNVKIAKWFPQRDILAHPNVKLFISHGGLMSTTEAVYSGVPMIGIPLFGDQPANLAAVEAKGAGIQLHFHNISLESVGYAVNTVLNDPRYAENAKRLSELYRDRPMSAMDTAVYWTEYVIRHKGTKHLQSAAMHLAWYQYLLLDVILVIGVVILAAIVISYYTVKYSFLLITYFLNHRKKLKKA